MKNKMQKEIIIQKIWADFANSENIQQWREVASTIFFADVNMGENNV